MISTQELSDTFALKLKKRSTTRHGSAQKPDMFVSLDKLETRQTQARVKQNKKLPPPTEKLFSHEQQQTKTKERNDWLLF